MSGAFDIGVTDDQMPLSDALDDESEEGARARHRLGRFIEDSPRGAEFRTRMPGLELRGLPLEVVDVDRPAIAEVYERRFVLVRPDGHVAWRADDLPPDPRALVDRIAGFRAG